MVLHAAGVGRMHEDRPLLLGLGISLRRPSLPARVRGKGLAGDSESDGSSREDDLGLGQGLSRTVIHIPRPPAGSRGSSATGAGTRFGLLGEHLVRGRSNWVG